MELVDPAQADALMPGLAAVLADCVEGGASVGFLAPVTLAELEEWWVGALRAPGTVTFAAIEDDRVLGVVQLQLATMPNSLHRANVAKLLVHRDARGRGVAAGLMARLESHARALGRTLLVLDTQTGSLAERLYERWGWQRVGVIDEFAGAPDGTLIATTYMVKRL